MCFRYAAGFGLDIDPHNVEPTEHNVKEVFQEGLAPDRAPIDLASKVHWVNNLGNHFLKLVLLEVRARHANRERGPKALNNVFATEAMNQGAAAEHLQ